MNITICVTWKQNASIGILCQLWNGYHWSCLPPHHCFQFEIQQPKKYNHKCYLGYDCLCGSSSRGIIYTGNSFILFSKCLLYFSFSRKFDFYTFHNCYHGVLSMNYYNFFSQHDPFPAPLKWKFNWQLRIKNCPGFRL